MTTPDPSVSIVVPVYNAERYLDAALRSMMTQTFPVHEIIVCDDASTDRSGAILEGLAREDPRVRVLRNPANLGGYGAINRAIGASVGDFIAVYHADDLYDPTIVAREVETLAAHPDVGAVFCLDRFIDAEGREYHRLRPSPLALEPGGLSCAALTDAMLREKNTWLRTPSVMFRRAALDETGRFDQERFGIAADADMWLRLSLRWKVAIVPEHLFGYRHYPEQWSRTYDRLRVAPDRFFAVMDHHLQRPGVREMVTSEALTLYRVWKVKDEAERAANHLVLGDRQKAVALLNTSLVRPLLRSERPGLVLRILALRSLVRAAVAAGGGRVARACVYFGRFRRLPPGRVAPPADHAAQTLAADGGEAMAPARTRRDVVVFLDPFSRHFYGNGIFDPDSKLNRDNSLLPWFILRQRLADLGIELHTADYLMDGSRRARANVYVSFGLRDHVRRLAPRDDVLLTAFYLFEVVVVEPDMYRAIPELANDFRTVYSWSDAASLAPFVEGPVRVAPFTIPMPRDDVVEPHWSRQDRAGIVMVSSNKQAALPDGELYTERLRALRHLAERDAIDLWGRLWDRGLGAREAEFGAAVRRAYRGPAADKYEVLGRYATAICYENMVLKGWITEKIFDCFYAGVVPVYLGAPDIAERIPPDCFIDRRAFASDDELGRFLRSLSHDDLRRYRDAARTFLRSPAFRPFHPETFADRFVADARAHLRERGFPGLPE